MRRREGFLAEGLLFFLAAIFFLVTTRGVGDEREGFGLEPRARGILRVATWNLGTGVDDGTDGLRDEYIPDIARALLALDPDLVLLQELQGARQLGALLELLGGDWSFTFARPSGTRMLGVLAQRGRLERGLQPPLDRAMSFTYESESGVQLLCVGMHANAFSARDRNQSIGLAGEFLDQDNRGLRTLLAGDLNLDLDIDKRRDLFTDNEYLDVETYNYLASKMLDTGLGGGPSAKPDRRIDYIFVESGAFQVQAAGPWRGQRVGGMDHEPVVADLRVVNR